MVLWLLNSIIKPTWTWPVKVYTSDHWVSWSLIMICFRRENMVSSNAYDFSSAKTCHIPKTISNHDFIWTQDRTLPITFKVDFTVFMNYPSKYRHIYHNSIYSLEKTHTRRNPQSQRFFCLQNHVTFQKSHPIMTFDQRPNITNDFIVFMNYPLQNTGIFTVV